MVSFGDEGGLGYLGHLVLTRPGLLPGYIGILTVMEQLLEQSPTTRYAYLCHPGVQHISKLKKEGKQSSLFYRNPTRRLFHA